MSDNKYNFYSQISDVQILHKTTETMFQYYIQSIVMKFHAGYPKIQRATTVCVQTPEWEQTNFSFSIIYLI